MVKLLAFSREFPRQLQLSHLIFCPEGERKFVLGAKTSLARCFHFFVFLYLYNKVLRGDATLRGSVWPRCLHCLRVGLSECDYSRHIIVNEGSRSEGVTDEPIHQCSVIIHREMHDYVCEA